MASKYLMIIMTAAILTAAGFSAVYAQETKIEKAAVTVESKCAEMHADCAAKCDKEKCICKDCATTDKCDPKCECCKECKDGKCCGEGKKGCGSKEAKTEPKAPEKEKTKTMMHGCGGCKR